MDAIANLKALLAAMDRHISQVEAEPILAGDIKAERRRAIRVAELQHNRGLIQWKLTLLLRELEDYDAILVGTWVPSGRPADDFWD